MERTRLELAKRLRARKAEIEQVALARIKAIADPSDVTDPGYVEGLREAVGLALNHGIAAIEHGGEREPQIPLALLAQARRAARNAVGLDAVLRRYFAGYSLLSYFTVEEAVKDRPIKGTELQRLLASQAALFDRLLAAVGEEHIRESETLRLSAEQRRTEQIERLLAGELLDTSGLSYVFEGWHLGIVISGPGRERTLHELTADLDCRRLVLNCSEEILWVWLGARRRLDPDDGLRALSSSSNADRVVAIGEPGEGLAGWRLSHLQARATWPIARWRPGRVARYADVALLASMLKDDLLATSLRQIYLAPLEQERDGGEAVRQTLRAYFSAGQNSASAAAALGVTRQTVTNRLRTVEDRLCRRIDRCAHELSAALLLEEFDRQSVCEGT